MIDSRWWAEGLDTILAFSLCLFVRCQMIRCFCFHFVFFFLSQCHFENDAQNPIRKLSTINEIILFFFSLLLFLSIRSSFIAFNQLVRNSLNAITVLFVLAFSLFSKMKYDALQNHEHTRRVALHTDSIRFNFSLLFWYPY